MDNIFSLLRYLISSIFLFGFCCIAQGQTIPWQEVRSATSSDIFIIAPTSVGLVIHDATLKVWISTDNAQSWKKMSADSLGFILAIAESKNSLLLMEYFFGNIAVFSKDSIFARPRRMPVRTEYGLIFDRAFHHDFAAQDSLVFVATATVFYRSANSGVLFKEAGSYLDDYTPYDVRRIFIDNNRVWVSSKRGVGLSRDYGVTWTLRGFKDTSVALLAASAGRVFASQGGRPVNYVRTLDTGKSWQSIPDPVQNTNESITRGFILYKQTIFLATDGGVYRSRDDGSTWQNISYNLPKGPINTMAFDTATKTLYVAMYKGGLYRADATTVGIRNEQASTAFLSTLAPNPAADFTDISFILHHATHTHLSLYSTLGTEVWRNEGGVLPAGEQRLRIDTRGLPSGVYMYRLTAGGVSSVGRIVVVR
jgi:hypothetical protein